MRRLLLLLLGTWLLAAATSAGAAEVLIPTDKVAGNGDGNFYLLAIGVSQFVDDFWPPLKYTAADADKVAKSLGQGTELKLVTVKLTDAQATRTAVWAALDKIRSRATARDTVAVYISSHGTLAEASNGELEKVVVLNDTKKDLALKTGLAHRELVDWLEGLPSRRKLLIFATCHSGVGKSRLSPKIERMLSSAKGATLAPLADVSEGALILAAAAKGEAAREDDKLGGDIYTHFLLEGLRVYDRNHDGVVTALEAHDYAKEKTYAFTQGRQRPTADARLIGDADVPLTGVRKRSGLPVLEAYDEGLAGFEVQVDGGTKGRLPLAFPLDRDGSVVALYAPESGKKLAEYQVDARLGQTVTLDEVMAAPPFDVGFGVGQETWTDSAFGRVAGAQKKAYTNLAAKYHYQEFFGGLNLRVRQRGEESDVRSGLDSTVHYQTVLAAFGYDWQLAHTWHLVGEGNFGQESLSVSFADEGGEAAEFSDSAPVLGVKASVARELGVGLQLSLEAGRLAGKHHFEALGSLNADRRYFGASLNYLFGGVGRRVSW